MATTRITDRTEQTEATESNAALSVLSALSGISGPNPAGLAKFDEMVWRGELEVTYENGRTRIYRVRG